MNAAGRWMRWPLDLGAILAAALLAMLHVGRALELNFDNWWHIIIACEDTWSSFWHDVAHNAHPPIYFLCLSAVSKLGSSRLIYRSVSILAALAAIAVFAQLLRRMDCAPPIVTLGTVVFGLSWPTLEVASEVRAYMLCTLFVVMAWYFFLSLVKSTQEAESIWARAGLAACLSLGVLTHYSTQFIVVAMLATSLLLQLGARSAHGSVLRAAGRNLLTFSIPLLVCALVYVVHLHFWSEPLGYIPQFYRGPAEGWMEFWVRVLPTQLAYFPPFSCVTLPPPLVLAILLGTLAAVRKEWSTVAVATMLNFTFLFLAVMLAGAMRRYPFGGELRHQYFLFPFGTLASMSVLDLIFKKWGRQWTGTVISVASMALMIGLTTRALLVPIQYFNLRSREFARLAPLLHPGSVLCVDTLSLIELFAHLRGKRLRYEGSVKWGRFDRLRIEGSNGPVTVLRHKTEVNIHEDLPTVLSELGAEVEAAHLSEVVGFHLDPLKAHTSRDEAAVRAEIEALAGPRKIQIDHLDVGPCHIIGRFKFLDRSR
jgi:hypothetical protein